MEEKMFKLEKFSQDLGNKIIELISEGQLDKFKKEPKQESKQEIKNQEFIKYFCKDFWEFLFCK